MKRFIALISIVLAVLFAMPIAAGPPDTMPAEGVVLEAGYASGYSIPETAPILGANPSKAANLLSREYTVIALLAFVATLSMLAGLMRGAVSKVTGIAKGYRVSARGSEHFGSRRWVYTP